MEVLSDHVLGTGTAATAAVRSTITSTAASLVECRTRTGRDNNGAHGRVFEDVPVGYKRISDPEREDLLERKELGGAKLALIHNTAHTVVLEENSIEFAGFGCDDHRQLCKLGPEEAVLHAQGIVRRCNVGSGRTNTLGSLDASLDVVVRDGTCGYETTECRNLSKETHQRWTRHWATRSEA